MTISTEKSACMQLVVSFTGMPWNEILTFDFRLSSPPFVRQPTAKSHLKYQNAVLIPAGEDKCIWFSISIMPYLASMMAAPKLLNMFFILAKQHCIPAW